LKKLTEHDDRVQHLESNMNELRSNNSKDHMDLHAGLQKAENAGTRNAEQANALWGELRKLNGEIARVKDCGLTADLLNQISINKESV